MEDSEPAPPAADEPRSDAPIPVDEPEDEPVAQDDEAPEVTEPIF